MEKYLGGNGEYQYNKMLQTDFGQIVEYTLYYFSDANETAYSQASYLRMINENGDVHCCLIFGKSRVAPVKYVSIPRLELTAATLSVKVSDMLRRELGIPIASRVLDRKSSCSGLHK